MEKVYSSDRNVQMLISVLKAYNIKKVIASPGTTNFPFVYSIQKDDFFEVYSCVDERSAAYMACGLSGETDLPVVITCTGATASRNYLPGLTEAFYRKLPILVIAGTDGDASIGHLVPQIMDRSCSPKDAIKYNVSIQNINCSKDEWSNCIKINSAVSELTRHGGGPVLITIQYSDAPFVNEKGVASRIIKRFFYNTYDWPSLENKSVAIFIGAHKNFSRQETEVIDKFCESYNAYVLCDHTSGYHGKYRINYSLVASQTYYNSNYLTPDVLIHLGEVSGEYYIMRKLRPKNTWRVNEDGEFRDKFKTLSYVFEMNEFTFFSHYLKDCIAQTSNFHSMDEECKIAIKNIKNIPFSNIWIASQLYDKMPKNCTIHFGILNSLRSWNFFELDSSISTSCNVGGFGIDGAVSTLNGASLVNKEKLYFAILGDLAFFYDLNSICNRHLSSNIRIMVLNNGHGTEFSNYDHPASRLGEDVDKYIAAGGHNGNKSADLLKKYSESLGFQYLSASSKEEFGSIYECFISPQIGDKPILFEVFTEPDMESEALKNIHLTLIDKNLIRNAKIKAAIGKVKQTIENII